MTKEFCGRCNESTDHVTLASEFCPLCDPTPLCPDCTGLHMAEVIADRQMGLIP